MSEAAIRTDIKSHLSGRCVRSPGTRWIEEMEVCAGRGRVDLAVITDRLIGIEIKGPRDSLARLTGQASHYSRCFDVIILVAHERWTVKAMNIIPPWWGFIQGSDAAGKYTYRLVRRPTINDQVDMGALVGLLWREEIARIFKEYLNRAMPVRSPKRALRAQLLNQVAPKTLKAASLEALRQRDRWRTREGAPSGDVVTCGE